MKLELKARYAAPLSDAMSLTVRFFMIERIISAHLKYYPSDLVLAHELT